MTQEIKQMIGREATEYAVNEYTTNVCMSASDSSYTAGRMKGIEEMEEFTRWVSENYLYLKSGTHCGKWFSPGNIYGVLTLSELLTIFYQQKRKVI